MNALQSKEQIRESLAGFGGNNLKAAAIGLLNTLGYRSEKKLDLIPNTAANFLAEFDKDGKADAAKALLPQWKSVEFLFQLSDDEIGNHLPFSTGKVDNSIIESYIFLAIDLAETAYTRTRLATATREINKLFPMPAMVLFRHGPTLTLAIIDRELNKRESSRDVLRKVTLIKDIRWAEPLRAHIDILHDLTILNLFEEFRFRNFVELHRAWAKKLNNSSLNKQFYREITDWYFWAVRHKGVEYPRDLDSTYEKQRSIFFIRLLTRLIFCWFLQEKDLIPRNIFRWNWLESILKDTKPASGTYYQAILQNLFFATLNREQEKRAFRGKATTGRYDGNRGVYNLYRYENLISNKEELLALFSKVPFINGGLFDCLDRVYKKAEQEPTQRIDGFSDNSRESVTVPNQLFFGDATADLHEDYNDKNKADVKVHGLIDILSRYKFTVEENTPLEEEIALDPELLGKVFENLLASYNEDTKATARAKIGAFYTPREVVQYMVDEALVAYFDPSLEPALRELLSDNPGNPLTDSQTQSIIDAIEKIRVLDPACGSGAFPMGVLHRLVHLLGKLDPNNRRWKEQQKARALRDLARAEPMEDAEIREPSRSKATARLKDIDHSFDQDHHELDFARKLYLIEHSIFGVDIEPIACQITKLRFFIALLVDQKVKAGAGNFGVRPLPNLETRIVAADSLTPIEKKQMFLETDQIKSLREKLGRVRHEHFNARTPEDKQRYRELDAALRDEVAEALERQHLDNQTARRLSDWDPYDQNTNAPFFDPKWMFSLDPDDFPGFDVVLGNPPYVRQEKIKEQKPELKKHYECYTGTADLYVFFYERSINLLRQGGVFTFITSNKWLRSAYGAKLRGWLKRTTTVIRLIDFGDAEIFKAIAYPCIVITTKGPSPLDSGFEALTWKPEWSLSEISKHSRDDSFTMIQTDLAPDAWRVETPSQLRLLERIKRAGQPLGKFVGDRIYYGIKTGFNDAFVVPREIRDQLIGEHHSSAELIKPFLRGRDIKRWRVEFEEQYLLFTRRGIQIDNYPAIKNHLKGFKGELEPMPADWNAESIGAWNGRKSGTYKWFEIQDNIAYWPEFEQPKIIVPAITNTSNYAPDTNGFFSNDKTSIVIPESVPFTLAILNSQVSWYCTQQTFATKQGGFFELKPMYFSQLTIPRTTSQQHEEVLRISEYLIHLYTDTVTRSPHPGAAFLERLMNGLVYELFFESEVHDSKLRFFDLLSQVESPDLKSIPQSQRTARIAEFHAVISNVNHPLYAALFALNSLEIVRIIEGKA
jgi:adenine-specific DNA-methyltransferase